MTKRLITKSKFCKKFGDDIWGHKIFTDSTATKLKLTPFSFDPKEELLFYYGKRLQAKQKLKLFYGNLTESFFKNTYLEANRLKGLISNNFILLLERRLDIIIYRLNFAESIFQARQLINHGHILVNSKVITIPSFLIQKQDLITVSDYIKPKIKKNIYINLKNKLILSTFFYERAKSVSIFDEANDVVDQFLINTFNFGNPSSSIFQEYYLQDISKAQQKDLIKKTGLLKKTYNIWEQLQLNLNRYCPNYLEFNPNTLDAIVIYLPTIEEIFYLIDINPKLIIEQYSK